MRTQVSLDRPRGIPIHADTVLPELLRCLYTDAGYNDRMGSSRQLEKFQNRGGTSLPSDCTNPRTANFDMLYAQMFGSPFEPDLQPAAMNPPGTNLPRFPAIEQAPECTCNSPLVSDPAESWTGVMTNRLFCPLLLV